MVMVLPAARRLLTKTKRILIQLVMSGHAAGTAPLPLIFLEIPEIFPALVQPLNEIFYHDTPSTPASPGVVLIKA
mgnify:CR=1 FL=1